MQALTHQGRSHQNRPCEEQGWKDCEQEGQPQGQEVPMDRSSQGCPFSSEDQGFRSCQEGNTTLCQGQGALPPVSALSNRGASRQGTSSRCGDVYICGAQVHFCSGSTWRQYHIDEGYI